MAAAAVQITLTYTIRQPRNERSRIRQASARSERPPGPGGSLDLVAALGAGRVRDLGLLDSACHRPRAGLFERRACPSLAGRAVALTHSLAGNHALVDGDKRLALLATVNSCGSTITAWPWPMTKHSIWSSPLRSASWTLRRLQDVSALCLLADSREDGLRPIASAAGSVAWVWIVRVRSFSG